MILKEQITQAVEELSAIPFFPGEAGARLAIMRAMEKFVANEQQLRWLVDAALNGMHSWGGPAALRGLYCSRFKPRDGIESDCHIAGFTAEDSESAYFDLQAAETSRRLAEYRKQRLLAAAEQTVEASAFANEAGNLAINKTQPLRSPRARERLRATLNMSLAPPISVRGTPKRSAEENERLVAELAEKLGLRVATIPEEVTCA